MTNLRKSIRMALACLYLLHCDSMDKFLPSAEMIFSGKSCNMESVPSLCIYSPLGRVPPNICFLPSVLTARYPGIHCAFLRHICELCLPCLCTSHQPLVKTPQLSWRNHTAHTQRTHFGWDWPHPLI